MHDMQNLPSPADSPSLKPADPQPSRKRQRSQSMQSDTSSSSLKRSVSDCPSHDSVIRSPRTDQMSTLSLSDPNHDIDTYMAEQGEADIPDIISLTPSVSHSATATPSLTAVEKLSLVENSKGKKMEVGDTWYLVSRDWWKRWKKACTGEVDKEGPVNEQELGPVNNSSLLDEYGNLRPSLVEQIDVEYVPSEVWSFFVTWYGEPIHPLPRKVIARGESQQTSLELRPPRLRVFRLSKSDPDPSDAGKLTSHVTLSTHDTVKTLCEDVANAVSPNPQTQYPYRVWKVDSTNLDLSGPDFPSSQLLSSDGKIIDESNKTLDDALIESGDVFVVEFKDTNGWIVDIPKPLQKSPTILGRQEPSPPLFSSGDGFFNRLGSNSSNRASSDDFYSNFMSSTLKPLTSSGSGQNGRGNRSHSEPGTLGLANMGNTCFMNSALQCLAHQKELTEYFLTSVYEEELNPDNPLGMHGAIAQSFGALLQRIWDTNGASTSYSPREFKQQLQRFAPQFSGYQQHDSQELVAFLLDGLHEDLNRVLKKPYVEKPDWEGGGDLELVQLAQKSWEGYMMRNDSVIVDLFQGQYQSTLVCPECEKVSITFDPFMYLTLPLPVQKKWRHTVFYVPWDLEKPHVKVPIELGRDASFRDLRHLLGRWMGAQPDNLLTLEIFNNRFYKNLDDGLLCGEMADSDTIVCFELPCHAQQSRTYKKEPGDPFIIPIYLCDVAAPVRNTYMSMGRGSASLFGYPTVMVIDREQATDVNAMYDAVVARLQRWTANARDLFTWEAGSGSGLSIEEVPIHINGLPPVDSITEINENGEVVTLNEASPEEEDIVDQKNMVVEEDVSMYPSTPGPVKVGTKTDIFNLRLQVNHKEYGTTHNAYASNNRFEPWDNRLEEAATRPVLLREGDAFYCEFDENMKAYYFGDDHSRWEHARWDAWELFVHPEYEEAKKAAAERKNKGLSLQDCLDEFTREEKLGEDDLWYCPRCKKHQQATKKFDLWKTPDVLVVHLKRFSNSRTLRDKIDTFIDFPIEGLDLGAMVGERKVAQRLLDEGVAVEELKLGNLDEPLIYDLFGVDEHMGGLGGGHYRAYALNHATEKWYHFDDSYVTPARPTDAVNANAYLLFYRRRTSHPLGGKTQKKIEEARLRPKVDPSLGEPMTIHTQLPTPPNESNSDFMSTGMSRLTALTRTNPALPRSENETWNLRSSASNAGSSVPSPPPDDPPDFDGSQFDELVSTSALDPLQISSQRFDFPDPSNKASPTSSNEAEPDVDTDVDDDDWRRSETFAAMGRNGTPSGSPDWSGASRTGSPSGSSISEMNPFSDANVQKHDEAMDSTTHERTA